MNNYMVCIDNNNYKVIKADTFEITNKYLLVFKEKTCISPDIEKNIAIFNFDNIKGFWQEDRIEKMGE